jgi:hypothetical protein
VTCSSLNFIYVEECASTVCVKLLLQNNYILGACYNNDFYITNSKFEVDRYLLVLYVNNFDFLYASKYFPSNSTVSFWFDMMRMELTTLRLINIKFLFQIFMYLLMTMYCIRFAGLIIFIYRYIITNEPHIGNKINGSKDITLLRLYKFHYRNIL